MNIVELHALNNVSILYEAREKGMKIYPEDLFVNYSEIDVKITKLENKLADDAAALVERISREYLAQISTPEDLERVDMALFEPLAARYFEFIRAVWEYGQGTADDELTRMEQITAGEIRAHADGEDLTNNDAYEWYQLYARRLAASGQDSVLAHMQPKILEKLDSGTVRLELADALTADFARYGRVRAEITARTESNKAFNWGRRWRFDKSPSIAGYRYSAILDARTTDICTGLHGHSWPISDPALDEYTPPNHYQCRSILVPISKYKDWAFKPPAGAWEEALPEKQREVLQKFKDSSWYPKASTVRGKDLPKDLPAEPAKQPAKKKTPAKKKPAKKKGQEPRPEEKLIQALVDDSKNKSISILQDFIELNVRRGLSRSHPALAAAQRLIDEIDIGVYAGSMITPHYNSRAKKYEIKEFTRVEGTDVFARYATEEAWNGVKDDIQKIGKDPKFLGVKFDIKAGTKGTTLASYYPFQDMIEYSPASGGLPTLYHEIGHRVHNTQAAYPGTSGAFSALGIAITDIIWSEWQKTVNPYWSAERTKAGDPLLPADMARRWTYPINAKFYYSKGGKKHFYMEMFAESSSVYLENNPAEIAKVRRTYPGLIEFMEEVYKRGHIK